MKQCAICGESFPRDEFRYGGRDGNSYCKKCSAEFAAEYNRRIAAGEPATGVANFLRGRLRRR